MDMFHYLHYGLAAVLVFVGVKMLLDAGWDYEIRIGWSLGIVGGLLAVATIASLLRPRNPGPLNPA
jgi:tellurite resistance protein TerC